MHNYKTCTSRINLGLKFSKCFFKSTNTCDININYLRGQGFDGALAMGGKFKGVFIL